MYAYVPKLRKNFVFVPLFNKFGFQHIFEGDKFIVSKDGMFGGQGYFFENIFKLNVAKLVIIVTIMFILLTLVIYGIMVWSC